MTASITCPEHLVIATVQAVHVELRAALAAEEDVVVDATGTTRVDAAGVQLLLALVEAGRSAQRQVELRPSPSLVSAIDRAGLRAVFPALEVDDGR